MEAGLLVGMWAAVRMERARAEASWAAPGSPARVAVASVMVATAAEAAAAVEAVEVMETGRTEHSSPCNRN